MSESPLRRHGLEAFLAEPRGAAASASGISITVRGDLGHINVRGRAADAGFVKAAGKALGQALPLEANTFSAGEHHVCWLGPDEWLIVTQASGTAELAERLEGVLAGTHAAVNDVSGGHVALMLRGPHCRELLAKGCTLDLHAREFALGDCAQSGLAKANVLLALVDESPTFMIVVRRSFADYLCGWLAHAGRDHGIEFSAA